MRRRLPTHTIALSLVVLVGCNTTILTPSPADRLREENSRLEADLARTSLELEESRRKLSTIETGGAGGAIDREALAAAPRLTVIEVAGSSVIECDAGGRGTLLVRLVPMDGRGRFLQITGRVSIRASVLDSESPPTLVGERTFGPIEVRDAWRSGFFGTVYLFEIPVELPTSFDSVDEASVLATFDDAIGGGTYCRLATVPIDVRSDRTGGAGSPERGSP